MVTRNGHKAAEKKVGLGKGARVTVKLDPTPTASRRSRGKDSGKRVEPATRENTRMNPSEFDKRKAASDAKKAEKKKRRGRR